MNSANKEPVIQRILVAVDASPHSLAALEMAAQIAARLEAELVGIYIEDINLLRLAEFPFVREVGFFSASLRELNVSHVERQLRSQARWSRRALEMLARSMNLRWSFRVERGEIPAKLLAATIDADLIILGKAGWSRRRQLGSTAQLVVFQSPRHTLILQSGSRFGRPVMIIYDGSPAGQKALSAAGLVQTEGIPLRVLILAKKEETAQHLYAEADKWCQEHDLETRFRWLSHMDGAEIARLAQEEKCGILVVPTESELMLEEPLIELLNKSECAVLLIR